jgi:uncharacterized protein
MRWILIVSTLLACCTAARAADVAIYSGSAEVASQSDADRESGLRAALRATLIKASGDARLAQEPALAGVLGRASGLVRHYTYRESTQAGADGATLLRLQIQAEFDPQGVESALRDLGRPLWGRERPTVLVWLVIDNNGSKQIVSAFQQSALGALLSTAEQRGLPLQLPRMDGVDLNRINPVTLWEAPPATVIGASQRYNARVILVARLQKLNASWTARYTLIEGHEFESWESSDALASGVLAQAIHGSVDRIARRYATDHSGPPLGAVQVWIEDLRSAADFAAAIGYLERLSAVSQVSGEAAERGRLLVSLQVGVGAQRLQQLLAMDKVLVMEPGIAADAAEAEPAVPAFVLRMVH